MLHPLYFVLVFTVECGFTRWYIWFSSTLTPKGFKSHAAPVLKICFWLYVTKIKVTYIMQFFKSLKWNSIFECSDNGHLWYQMKAYICVKMKARHTWKHKLLCFYRPNVHFQWETFIGIPPSIWITSFFHQICIYISMAYLLLKFLIHFFL